MLSPSEIVVLAYSHAIKETEGIRGVKPPVISSLSIALITEYLLMIGVKFPMATSGYYDGKTRPVDGPVWVCKKVILARTPHGEEAHTCAIPDGKLWTCPICGSEWEQVQS